jgi:hypothetical protein
MGNVSKSIKQKKKSTERNVIGVGKCIYFHKIIILLIVSWVSVTEQMRMVFGGCVFLVYSFNPA